MSLALNTVVANEEHRIIGLLDHASTYCDELVVVVDEHSADATEQLAHDYGATVVIGPHSWYCEPLRPLAADHSESPWVIVLDADEVLSDAAVETVTTFDRLQYKSVRFPREHFIDGEQVYLFPDWHIRMFRRGHVQYGMDPHTKITAIDPNAMFTTQNFIVHTKSSAEHEADVERSERQE